MSALGEAMRAARHAKGLSLRDVGKALGISHVYVGEVERGVRGPFARARLEAVVALLDVDPQQMLVAAACDRGAVDVSALAPAQVAQVVALVERLRATPAPEAT